MLANKTQHGYYRNVRDQKRNLENRLGLGDLALATTPGMGGARERLGRVTTFQNLILGALLVADLTGFAFAVRKHVGPEPAPKVEVAARVVVGDHRQLRSVRVVFSRDGRIAAAASPRPGEVVILRLSPGRYQVGALAGRLCTSTRAVTTAPLQSLAIRCP
jgi:hypothetical protein